MGHLPTRSSVQVDSMIKINETFQVRSLFNCDNTGAYVFIHEYDPVWRQTVVGCMILNILRDMYGFNVSYPMDDNINPLSEHNHQVKFPKANDSIDIYVKPMEIQQELLDHAYPIQSIFIWRLGFILRREHNGVFRAFYSKPFNQAVWICIFTTIVCSSLIFYALSHWDSKWFGRECSYTHELLLAFSAYCQHIMPLPASSYSRRIAYFTFIICAYVVHSFYTSNLLSHLVSEKDKVMDLYDLAESDYKIVLLKDMNLNTDKRVYEKSMDKNLSIVWKKVMQLQIMNLSSALEAVVTSKTALVTEYFTLYPILKRYLDSDDICQLIEIDLYSNVKEYFFTSKNFAYKEEFKIGCLRLKEAGLMRYTMNLDEYSPPKCEITTSMHIAHFEHIFAPITILSSAYLLTLLMLLGERIHYQMNRVWPYVE